MPKLKLGEVSLHYEVHGEGKPLLLLHGLGSSSRDWEYQIPDLARRYRVIAPSLRGFGESDKPDGPYTVMQFARDCIDLLNHLGVDRTHVFGFSMGGAVAFQLAVEFQHRLESLIVVNSQPSFELDHWRSHLMVLMRIGMANIMGMERMTRFLARRMFPAPEQKALRDRMTERYRNNDKTAYLAALRSLAGWSVEDYIGSIDVPTLVLAGEYDFTPVEAKQQFVDKMPNASLRVVRDSRHGTPFDQHKVVNSLVLDFLETTNWGRPRSSVRPDNVRASRAALQDARRDLH